jgi:uncharacterized membrane protein YoaK (UPF0700 family)
MTMCASFGGSSGYAGRCAASGTGSRTSEALPDRAARLPDGAQAARVRPSGVEALGIADRNADIPAGSPATDGRLPSLLLALTLTTGLIDAASYLGLGHVFTANMTGNVVLLGFGLAHAGGLPVVAPLISLGAFLLGAGVGGRLAVEVSVRHARVLLFALCAEVSLLVAASVLALAAHVRIGSAAAYAIIALVALAMGVRNAIVRKLAVADLTTTVLTMTLTGLIADSVGGAADWRKAGRRAGAVVAMLLGALAGGLLQKHSLAAPLLAAAGVAGVCTVVYAAGHRAKARR